MLTPHIAFYQHLCVFVIFFVILRIGFVRTMDAPRRMPPVYLIVNEPLSDQ